MADTSEISKKLKGLSMRKKRELAASIVTNFEELFWVTDIDSHDNADIDVDDEDEGTGVVTTMVSQDTASDIIGTGQTGDSALEVGLINDDDVFNDHVLEVEASIRSGHHDEHFRVQLLKGVFKPVLNCKRGWRLYIPFKRGVTVA